MKYKINYKGNQYCLIEGETVLEGLLRAEMEVPHSCKAGICQTCVMQLTEGTLSEKAQAGLKPTLKEQNYFLACQCHPSGDMVIKDVHSDLLTHQATMVETSYLAHNVLKVILKTDKMFQAFPGQFLTLINPDHITRCYSIANNPMKDLFIELHIRLREKGIMSNWLKNETNIGATITLRGPGGTCYYLANGGKNDFPMILAGTGTGLAPLYGILNEAIAQNHQGTIHLFHGALNDKDLYLVEQLQKISADLENINYIPCVFEDTKTQGIKIGHIEDIVMTYVDQLTEKNNARLYICGDPQMVNSLKTKAFLSGIASKNIYLDAFLPTVAVEAA